MFVKGLIVAVVTAGLALLSVLWTDAVAPGLAGSTSQAAESSAPSDTDPAPVLD
jgi:hypothetical protein